MATTTVAPAPEAQPSLSAAGRVFGVFFSPKPTFEDIVRKPSWAAPVILLTLLSVVVCVALNQRINWQDYIAQQVEKSPRAAQMSAEQKAQQASVGAKYAPVFTYVFGVPAPFVFILILSLVMWGAYSLLGGISTNFSTSLSIIAHSFLVWSKHHFVSANSFPEAARHVRFGESGGRECRGVFAGRLGEMAGYAVQASGSFHVLDPDPHRHRLCRHQFAEDEGGQEHLDCLRLVVRLRGPSHGHCLDFLLKKTGTSAGRGPLPCYTEAV